MSAFTIRAAVDSASAERPDAPQSASDYPEGSGALLAHPNRIRTLYRAMTSCDAYTAAAEGGLSNGSVAAVRRAFEHAEAAFEEAQQCIAEIPAQDVTVDARQRLSELGLRLDALWMRLVCVYR